MNFEQFPGIYDANTDKLIMDYEKAESLGIVHQVNNIIDIFRNLEQPFYVILPDDITILHYNSFSHCDNLVGISGKQVQWLDTKSFDNCSKLEKLDFPTLNHISIYAFVNCEKLEEKYTNSDGLFIINDKWLIDSKGYKKENLIIPGNIEVISTDALMDLKLNTLVFPYKLVDCTVSLYEVKNVFLPIEFSYLECTWDVNKTKTIYKGTPKQFEEHKRFINTENMDAIINIPYTIKELNDMNYSLEEMENILNRPLTLDELLELKYTIKEANEYFKTKEETR